MADSINPSAPQQTTNWQPIETAPKDGTPVLVWAPNSRQDAEGAFRREGDLGFVIAAYNGGWISDLVEFETGWESTGSYMITLALNPTHWMRLPESP